MLQRGTFHHQIDTEKQNINLSQPTKLFSVTTTVDGQ